MESFKAMEPMLSDEYVNLPPTQSPGVSYDLTKSSALSAVSETVSGS